MYCFFISIFAISIVLLPDFNMKRIQVLLLFIVISCSMFAQDRLSLFIGRANKYAAVELSDYRKRLCVEYNISNQLLDDYYRRCGSNWGNVGLALEIAKTSGRHMHGIQQLQGQSARRLHFLRIRVSGYLPERKHGHVLMSCN